MCGEPRSKHALIQKRPEIKYKIKKFFDWKLEPWNSEPTESTPYMKGVFPLQRPALYAKAFYCFKK